MSYQSRNLKYDLYKMRAESLKDIYRFIIAFAKKRTLGIYNIYGDGGAGDVVIEFQTYSAYKTILRTLEKVPDGHVMIDTLKLKTEYTGKRY